MRTTKLHRVVNADLTVFLASLQSEQAIACAENEGWPVVPDVTASRSSAPASRRVRQPSQPVRAAGWSTQV